MDGAFFMSESTSICFGVKSIRNVAIRGVIDWCDALGWIEECSTLGSPIASGSEYVDSMLIICLPRSPVGYSTVVLWMLTKWF